MLHRRTLRVPSLSCLLEVTSVGLAFALSCSWFFSPLVASAHVVGSSTSCLLEVTRVWIVHGFSAFSVVVLCGLHLVFVLIT